MRKSLVFLTILCLMLLAACGNSDVSTGGGGNSTEKKESITKKDKLKKDGSKTINATKFKKEALGMKVGLGEIKISEDRISVGMNLKNTTDKMLMFYPDQGQLVVGDMQLDANLFMTSGDIGGEVQGGVKQEGVVEFLVPEGKKINIKSVKEVKLILGDVTSEDFMNSKPINISVPVK